MKEIRISINPASLVIEGATNDDFIIVGEYESHDEDSDEVLAEDCFNCLLIVPRSEVFRVMNEWADQKKHYDERHPDFIACGIDGEGTPVLEYTEEMTVPECRDNKYAKCFRVTKLDSPDLENG